MTVGERLADLTMESTVEEILLERVKELQEIEDRLGKIVRAEPTNRDWAEKMIIALTNLRLEIFNMIQRAKEAYNAF